MSTELRAEPTDVCSLPALRLENEFISLEILPEPGGKISSLVWKPSGRHILWQNPRVRPQPFPVDANFDNYWCGGWDEGFPTCDGCDYNGESYPNLGELRSVRWSIENFECRDGACTAELSAFGPITPARVSKAVTLRGASVFVRYEVTNIGPLPFDFIWGSHPALAVHADTVLHIPAETGIVQLSSCPALGTPGQRYPWPMLETPDGVTDMRRVRSPLAGMYCGHYATGLRLGAYGVQFADEDIGLIVRFPRENARGCGCGSSMAAGGVTIM